MIGVNTSIFKSAGRKLVNLLGALKDRATYYENGTDSVAEKNRIDDLGVLDKATILLTPTATSNARVHSVKTYTGDELVTNGGFDTDSDWTLLGDWEISGGTLNIDGGINNATQGGVFETGKFYKFEFDITVNSGYCRVYFGTSGTTYKQQISSSGHYIIYGTAEGTTLTFRSGSNTDVTIDNVSVVDVSSDFDFDRASSATRINSSGLVQDMQSITDPELVLNGDFEELGDELVTNGTFDTDSGWSKSTGWSIADGVASFNTTTNGSITQSGYANSKTYKVSIDVVSYVRGNPFVAIGQGSQYTIPTSIGTHIIYVTSGSVDTILRIYSGQFGVGGEGSIDNVSVKQVDPNDRWSVVDSDANNYVEFTEGFARLKFLNASPITTLNSTLTLEQDKTYELVVDVHDVTSGSIKIDAAGMSELFDAEGVTTRYLKPTSDTTLSFYRATANVDITLASVSVKDITFSTDVDLARINYDSNGDNGHILLEPTSTNLFTYSEDFDEWEKNSSITITPNSTISPDGTNNASKVTFGGSGYTFVRQSFALTSDTVSFFVKKGNWRYVGVRNCVAAGANHTVFDFDTESFVNIPTGQTCTFDSHDNGWYRIKIYNASPEAISAYRGFALSDATGSENNPSGATNGSYFYIWGAQCENLPYATSYIPNYTSGTVTRAAETLTGSGNSTLINSTEGVLYAEIAGLVDDDSTSNSYHRIISISDNSTTNRVELKALNDGTLEFRFDSSSSDIRLYHASFDFTIFNKIALVWESGRCAAYLNGVKVVEDLTFSTFSSNALHELSFDSPYDGGSNFFYGKCKALAVFNEALEDDELELLTGVTNYGSFSELASANGYTII